MNDEIKKSMNEEAYTNYAIYMRLDNYIKNQEEKDEIRCKNQEEKDKLLSEKIDIVIKAQKYTNGNVMDLLLWRATTKGQFYIIPLVVAAIISGIVGILIKNFF